MLDSKRSRLIEWGPADAIVCAGYLLPPKSLSLSISLATAGQKMTQLFI